MFDQTWPVTYIHHNQTAAASEWVVLYCSDEYYTGAMGCAVDHGRPDLLAKRRAAMRASFTLAWSGVLLVGLRPSRGVSRRVERPPEWTGRNEWLGFGTTKERGMAKKAVKVETPAEVVRDIIMHVIGMVDYDIAKYYVPATSEEPEEAEREMKQLVASIAKRFDVSRKGKP